MKAMERIRARQRGEKVEMPKPKPEMTEKAWAIIVPKASLSRGELEQIFDDCPEPLKKGTRFEKVTAATFPNKSALIEAIGEIRTKYYGDKVHKIAEDAEKYLAGRASIQQQIADEQAERESLYWDDDDDVDSPRLAKPSYATTSGATPYQQHRWGQERVKKGGRVIDWYRAGEKLCEISAKDCNAYLAALPQTVPDYVSDQETGLHLDKTDS